MAPVADAMPSIDIVFTAGLVLVCIVPSLITFWIQRGVSSSDAEQVKWKNSMEARMSAAEEKAHAQDLMIQEKVTRADLDRVVKDIFLQITALGDRVEGKFDALQRLVIESIQRPR